MKVVELRGDVHIGEGLHKLSLLKDNSYVMSDTDLMQLKNLGPDKIGDVKDYKKFHKPYDKGVDLSNKTILVFRSGGIGDLLFMTPSLKYIKNNYENCKIIFAAGFLYMDALYNNPHIDKLYSMPFKTELLDEADIHFMFEGIIEDSSLAQVFNAYDLFLDAFKIDLNSIKAEDKKPIISISHDLSKWADEYISDRANYKEGFKVALQPETSTVRRTFPLEKFIGVMRVLLNEGFTIFIPGSLRQIPVCESLFAEFKEFCDNGRLILLPPDNLPLKKTIAVISKMDLVITSDSAFGHVAGAFDIPQVSIYGPFNSKLRLCYYSNAIGLNAQVACGPCYKHGHWPCEKGSPSPCFSVIDVEAILESVDFLRRWFEKPLLEFGKDKWRHIYAYDILPEFEKYIQNGEGIDIGCGYWKQAFMKRMDMNPLVQPDMMANIEDWSDDKEYDFVFSSFCLQEVDDKKSALTNMFKMVKSGGHVLLYLPPEALAAFEESRMNMWIKGTIIEMESKNDNSKIVIRK